MAQDAVPADTDRRRVECPYATFSESHADRQIAGHIHQPSDLRTGRIERPWQLRSGLPGTGLDQVAAQRALGEDDQPRALLARQHKRALDARQSDAHVTAKRLRDRNYSG
jgi:hypothetical protein